VDLRWTTPVRGTDNICTSLQLIEGKEFNLKIRLVFVDIEKTFCKVIRE
jgi:hypothetical protein